MEESDEPKIDMTNESVPEDVAKNPDLDPNVEMADQEYEVINPNPNQIGILRGGEIRAHKRLQSQDGQILKMAA